MATAIKRIADRLEWVSASAGIIKAGSSSVPVNIKADSYAPVRKYFQSYDTTGGIRAEEISLEMKAASNGNQVETLRVICTANVKMGAWCQAIFAQLDYQTDGLSHGAGSAICAEISLPASSVVRGTYYVWQSELDFPTNCVMNANPVGVMSISVWGAAKTQFDTVGLLLDIAGVTAGAGKFFDSSANLTNPQIDHSLKVRVNGALAYIPLMDNADGS